MPRSDSSFPITNRRSRVRSAIDSADASVMRTGTVSPSPRSSPNVSPATSMPTTT